MFKYLFSLLFLTILFSACTLDINHADTIYYNATIYTVDSVNSVAEAVAVKDGKIIAVGDFNSIKMYQGEGTILQDLEGLTMIPGFIESHAHLLGLGKQARQLNLMNVKSYEEMVAAVAQAAQNTPKGEWILGRGWHQSKWDSMPSETVTGYQTHEALSKISPDHPVMLVHASGHALMANAKAMELAKVNLELDFGEDGEIIRYPDGSPTGIFTENAMEIIQAQVPQDDPESLYKDLKAAIAECLKYGITSFQDAGSDAQAIEIYRRAIEEGEMQLRLWAMLSFSNYDQPAEGHDPFLEEWFKKGPEIGDWLTIRAVKLYADGALGSRGAWMIDEYSDRAGHYGNPTLPVDIIDQMAKKGLKHGFQICTHAIGDRANREVLDAYGRAFAEYPEITDHRFRIEHAQHIDPSDISKFKEYGVIASVQAIHFASDRPWAISRIGQLRIAMGAYRWRQLLESGAKVINGTDAPVEPVDPIPCFYTTVTRKTRAGDALETDQKLSRTQALRTYTIDAAYGAFQEKEKGSIEVGKFADFTILSQDIMKVPEDEILNTKVVQTIVGGELKYEER
jgi:predicted amidohydrolase YtcJ